MQRYARRLTTKFARGCLAFGALAGTAILTACSSVAAGGGAPAAGTIEELQPLTLRYATVTSETASQGKAAQAFAERVEKDSGGKITVEIFYNASLLSGQESLKGISSGVADLGWMTPLYYPQELPVNNWVMKMGHVAPRSFPTGIFAGSAAAQELQVTQPALDAEWQEHNAKLLWTAQPSIAWSLLCTKPVESLADAKGLRTRSSGSPWNEELQALGMVPVKMSPNEMYEGLQRGVIDCVIGTPSTFISFGLLEVAKHFTPLATSPSIGADTLVMNRSTWDSLPAPAQELIAEAAHNSWNTELQDVLKSGYISFFEKAAIENKVVFHDSTALDQTVKAHQSEAFDALADNAPPALEDPQALIDAYKLSVATWTENASATLGVTVPSRPVPLAEAVRETGNINFSDWDERTLAKLFERLVN
jgi:TRAP-type C4-dicarboxylate transport system substrate-binding protein